MRWESRGKFRLYQKIPRQIDTHNTRRKCESFPSLVTNKIQDLVWIKDCLHKLMRYLPRSSRYFVKDERSTSWAMYAGSMDSISRIYQRSDEERNSNEFERSIIALVGARIKPVLSKRFFACKGQVLS
ncbi:hypothetical protein ACS0PU_009966 [Formica fusca]